MREKLKLLYNFLACSSIDLKLPFTDMSIRISNMHIDIVNLRERLLSELGLNGFSDSEITKRVEIALRIYNRDTITVSIAGTKCLVDITSNALKESLVKSIIPGA